MCRIQPKSPGLVKTQDTKQGNQNHRFDFNRQLKTHINGDRLVQNRDDF